MWILGEHIIGSMWVCPLQKKRKKKKKKEKNALKKIKKVRCTVHTPTVLVRYSPNPPLPKRSQSIPPIIFFKRGVWLIKHENVLLMRDMKFLYFTILLILLFGESTAARDFGIPPCRNCVKRKTKWCQRTPGLTNRHGYEYREACASKDWTPVVKNKWTEGPCEECES